MHERKIFSKVEKDSGITVPIAAIGLNSANEFKTANYERTRAIL
jgi:hypothetical protein